MRYFFLSADTHFYSHVWFLNELEVVLKPPEGKGLFLELPYRCHNPQLDIFMSWLLSDRDQISPQSCYCVYAPREGGNTSSRHSFPDPALPSRFSFSRRNTGMCRETSINCRRQTLLSRKVTLKKKWTGHRHRQTFCILVCGQIASSV